MTAPDAPAAAIVGLADRDDIFTTVATADLIALLEVAGLQMDVVDADEADGYGLTPERCAELYSVSQGLLADLGVK